MHSGQKIKEHLEAEPETVVVNGTSHDSQNVENNPQDHQLHGMICKRGESLWCKYDQPEKNEVLTHAETWMNHKDIKISEINETQEEHTLLGSTDSTDRKEMSGWQGLGR